MTDAQQAFFKEKQRTLGVRLNKIQQQAVLQTAGPLLLLASPGSGKTTTIIMRIGYMIEVLGVKPSRIKAVTFSKASANDMKDRFLRFFPHLDTIDFSTIHSLAFEVVRKTLQAQGTDFRIIEESDKPGVMSKKRLLRELYEQINQEKITEDQLDELLTYISYVKNKMLPESEWALADVKIPNKVEIFKRYEAYKQQGTQQLLIDFDDMLLLANQIFTTDRAILAQYQRQFDYYLTDESQDTSPVQHAILEKLVAVHQNICVVADEDQAIYSWRGADPDYLLDFRKVYPQAEVLLMTQNYRSSANIVRAANSFIKRNKKRYKKEMFTENPVKQEIKFRVLDNYRGQAKYLVEAIRDEEQTGTTAILFRNNSSAIPLMDALDRAGIEFYMKDSSMRFFSHWIVEDILNFMRLAFNTKNVTVFEKIYRKMNAYITPTQMKAVMASTEDSCVFTKLLEEAPLKDYQPDYVKNLRKVYDRISFDTIKPTQMIAFIRNDLGYDRALKKTSESLGLNYDHLLDVVQILSLLAREIETLTDFANRLKELESLARSSHAVSNKQAITLSTLHSSKGLEFDRVFLIDLVEGILPSVDPIDAVEDPKQLAQLEEDTRLFYVGITRAISELTLFSYTKRFQADAKPSLFMRELKRIVSPQAAVKGTGKPSKELVQHRNEATILTREPLREGVKLRHILFGECEVLSVANDAVELKFETGVKKFLIDTCLKQGYLEKVD